MKKVTPEEIPAEVRLDVPYITLAGDRTLTAENYRGIISYESDSVKINTSCAVLLVTGEELSLSSISEELISVSGRIRKVEFV